jgi:hypothetical protein
MDSMAPSFGAVARPSPDAPAPFSDPRGPRRRAVAALALALVGAGLLVAALPLTPSAEPGAPASTLSAAASVPPYDPEGGEKFVLRRGQVFLPGVQPGPVYNHRLRESLDEYIENGGQRKDPFEGLKGADFDSVDDDPDHGALDVDSAALNFNRMRCMEGQHALPDVACLRAYKCCTGVSMRCNPTFVGMNYGESCRSCLSLEAPPYFARKQRQGFVARCWRAVDQCNEVCPRNVRVGDYAHELCLDCLVRQVAQTPERAWGLTFYQRWVAENPGEELGPREEEELLRAARAETGRSDTTLSDFARRRAEEGGESRVGSRANAATADPARAAEG